MTIDHLDMVSWPRIFINAGKGWIDDNVFKHAAAVSFYTLFSLAPVTIIALTVASFFLGEERASHELQKQVSQLVGPASAELVQAAATASQREDESFWATIVGVGLLLFGATTVFGQLQESLNQIWNVRSKPKKHGWLVLVLHRLLSFAMVLTIGFLLLVSLVASTAVTSALSYFENTLLTSAHMLRFADMAVSLTAITALFALLFKVLPDVHLRWKDVWLSAAITSVLFAIGRYLIALYLAHSTVASVYGAAGSLVALLIWVYYSCAILFYGVEFTRAHRQANKLKVIPKENAVVVREEIVETRKKIS